jgi:hypothetical protein
MYMDCCIYVHQTPLLNTPSVPPLVPSQGIASYCEWNVSATHSIIGGIIGFAFAAKGPKGVLWVR